MTLTGLRRFLLTTLLSSSDSYVNPSDHRMIGQRSRTPSCMWAVVSLTPESLPPLPRQLGSLSSRSGIPEFLLQRNEIGGTLLRWLRKLSSSFFHVSDPPPSSPGQMVSRIRAACTNDESGRDSPPSSSPEKKQKVRRRRGRDSKGVSSPLCRNTSCGQVSLSQLDACARLLLSSLVIGDPPSLPVHSPPPPPPLM